ncbi:EAL domain-containing protein [Tardiphaga alba]|uniref:EAL domain-containing protein n=1 Tax=Tardiphaga alba TaxID=340268 RepID=A0ABX8ABI6_9BRAD|nr:EAL domain-containing protein [Tardiphaga alba]QUS41067.1 EAL domain-containing protein [Tardiphaga alba]
MMRGSSNIFVWRTLNMLRVPRENPELVQAKLAAFTRQVPMMYALVIVNTMALASTFHGAAPRLLTLDLPVALAVVCLFRITSWWQSRHHVFDVDQAADKLRSSIIFAAVLGVAFCAWSLSLFPYGTDLSKSHVAFFMAVTSIGCGFCLMHLRAAALVLMSIVVIPFAIYFGTSDNPVFVSLAFNFTVVTLAVVFMLLGNHKDFEQRVNSEKALRIKQAELQVFSDKNFRDSNIDSLTGLPNRRSFFAAIEKQIPETKRAEGRLALGILDLDGFKPINDVHGHRVGDRLLIEVADRLRAHLPDYVFLGRLGGDEFAMFSERLTDEQAFADAERDLIGLFDAPFEIEDLTVRIGCSIGYAQYPEAATTAEDLFECADYALFFAKHNDRGKAVRFSAEHEATIREASRIDQALVNADLEQELWIAYQPIMSAATQQPVAFEALARWRSPMLGNVPPMTFIVAAERSGMIAQLTPILLRKALEGAARWPEHIRISFNLSAVDVASPLSVLKLINVVEQSGVRPARIDFEITETAVMSNVAQTSQSLNALRALGARISLDDFGTGYSSLSNIRELPLDKVKIDRSFISKIETDPAARLILRTMIDLCNGLGHDCIVEGVETVDQVDFLRKEDCRFMQGYFFAKPMHGEEVRPFLGTSSDMARIAALRHG